MADEPIINLIGISGSLRTGSWNTALLETVATSLPTGVALEIADIADIPLFNEDLEPSDFPAAVSALKDRVAAADGLVIATPEYNGGVPGVAKNVIDWLSRPIADQPRVLHGRPVCLMGATPGPTGTGHAQAAWLPILRTLRMPLWADQGAFLVRSSYSVFEDGKMTDEALRDRLRGYLAAYVDWVQARR